MLWGGRCRRKPAVGLLLLFLAAAASGAQRRESLIYTQFDVDPGEKRYFEFPAKQPDARLEILFEVLSPNSPATIRAMVLGEKDFQRLRENRPHRLIDGTTYRKQGSMRVRLGEAGGYAVVVDSGEHSRGKTRVEMRVTLTTGPDPETLPVRYASPRRRLAVVSVSLAGFLIILALSAQALRRATRWRRFG